MTNGIIWIPKHPNINQKHTWQSIRSRVGVKVESLKPLVWPGFLKI